MSKKSGHSPATQQPGGSLNISPTHLRISRYAAILISLYLICMHLFTGFDKIRFHPDEAGWISAGYYEYQLMFVQHDFDLEKWQNSRYTTYGWVNLPVAKYLIGMALDYTLPRGEYYYGYDFSKSLSENISRGNVSPPNILYPARWMSSAFAFGSCLSMFWLCAKIWNWVVGLIASLTLCFNSLFTIYAHRAMADSYLVFFFLLTMVFLVYLYAKRNVDKRTWLLLCSLYGVLVGLCTSVKINGILCGVYLLCLLTYFLITNSTKQRHSILFYISAFVLSMLCAGLTIVIINPFFYTGSVYVLIERASSIVSTWHSILATQAGWFPQDVLSGLSTRFMVRITMDYLHWIVTIFALAGFVKTIADLSKNFMSGKSKPIITPIFFFVVNLIGIGSWISLDWDRYYLPIIITEIPIAAYGMYVIGEFLFSKVSRSLVSSKHTTAD